ncbi:DUF2589 domain-containing protein [Govanella unica]|uniref:DUF2589 domain-containing protein n=1 Tax=Govanella unica TaxID=2975056 RepID=A0A9X3TWE1_9PROT|nr:DUF2589 domain-containing protein [Govania unica]MDA5193176.1 DUF2589 domain-containing protein [Govania unica]
MENQHLTSITRGLQHAAAETNSMVAEQFIRVLSQYFDKDEDGTLHARMVRVQLDEDHHTFVPLVSLATPSGLALDRMRVELSLRLEGAQTDKKSVLKNVRNMLKKDSGGGEDDEMSRADFKVSLSPRDKSTKGRPSDHVHIDLEFRSIETPESVMRVIDTYTNMMEPLRSKPAENDEGGPDLQMAPPRTHP